MKNLSKWVSKTLVCLVFITVAVLMAIALKSRKSFDSNEKFLLEAEITGSGDLIKQYDRKVSECVSFIGFKNDSIERNEGDRDLLKEGVNKLQADIVDYQKSIIFFKETIKEDSITYNKMIKK